MKYLLSILLLFSSNYFFGQNSNNETFNLVLNKGIKVVVNYSKEAITTTTILANQNEKFNVNYYFDEGKIYYIQVINEKLGINKTFDTKRRFINGHGYKHNKSDFKIDFMFPRDRSDGNIKEIEQIANQLDFSNNDQLIIYFEELYRNISQHIVDEVGTIAFFGTVVADKKQNQLYYTFDKEKFTSTKKTNIRNNYIDNSSKKSNGSYRIDFERTQLKNHNNIYFTSDLLSQNDSALLLQNSINLLELRKEMSASVAENETIVNNDIFLNQHFDQIIKPKNEILKEEIKYIGIYKTKNNEEQEILFELRANNIYYCKIGDVEKMGHWKLGKVNFLNNEAINIYNVYTINKKIGNKNKPSDFGSNIDLMIEKENLLYPISLPQVWNKVYKLK